jgi:cell division protein FtsQ
MEKFINDISLVKECQVYKSTKGYVNIDIECRIPVLIVYNKEGENYSIDGDGNMIHGIQKAIRLPMVTGNVNSNMANNELKEIARAIHGNRFWEAQIEQIHFNEKGYVIMVPRVGDHIIELGKAEQVEEKLEKLYTFYKQGMNNVGWNKYSKVNIEFNDKVICTRKEK